MKFELSPHIAIQVKDYENALNFYQKILGFEYVKSIPEHKETHFQKDGTNFYIEDNSVGKIFFEFKVNSVEKALELLLSQGCELTKRYTEKSAMIEDPFGMNFHIWEEGEFF